MSTFGERVKAVFKSGGELVVSLLGIDRFKESKEGKALADEAKKTGNSLFAAFGAGTPFQTTKMKEQAERDAKAKERANISSMAESSDKIVELLEDLNKKL